MQPTEQQVQRSLDALRTRSLDAGGMHGTRPSSAERWSGDLCRLDDLPSEVLTRLLDAPALRSDRLERARQRLARGDSPTAEDLAEKMIGRLVCDRLR